MRGEDDVEEDSARRGGAEVAVGGLRRNRFDDGHRDQFAGQRRRGVGHDLFEGAGLQDLPVAEEGHGVTDLADDGHLVGDDDDGDAGNVAHVAQQRQDLSGRLGVERAGRLVTQEHGGIVGQGAGDTDALTLAARQLGRVGVAAAFEADEFEEFRDAFAALRGGNAGELERVADVVGGGASIQEVRRLEHHADTAACSAQRGTRQGRQVEAVDDNVAIGGLLQGRQTPDERGLTGTGAADDPVDRTAINVQVHPIKRDDRAAVFHGVDLGHPGEVNHVHLRYWATRPATSAYEGHARERSECCYKTPYRG